MVTTDRVQCKGRCEWTEGTMADAVGCPYLRCIHCGIIQWKQADIVGDVTENEIGEPEYPPITPMTWIRWCGATIATTMWLAVALWVVAALIRILMKGAGMG